MTVRIWGRPIYKIMVYGPYNMDVDRDRLGLTRHRLMIFMN